MDYLVTRSQRKEYCAVRAHNMSKLGRTQIEASKTHKGGKSLFRAGADKRLARNVASLFPRIEKSSRSCCVLGIASGTRGLCDKGRLRVLAAWQAWSLSIAMTICGCFFSRQKVKDGARLMHQNPHVQGHRSLLDAIVRFKCLPWSLERTGINVPG